MQYNFKSFVLKIITRSCNIFLGLLLVTWNNLHINDYHLIENIFETILLLEFDSNTWNHKNCVQIIYTRLNYLIYKCVKKNQKNLHKNVNINLQWTESSNL